MRLPKTLIPSIAIALGLMLVVAVAAAYILPDIPFSSIYAQQNSDDTEVQPVLTVERALYSDRARVILILSWTDVPGLTPERSRAIYFRALDSGEEYDIAGFQHGSRTSPSILFESSLSGLDPVPYELAIGFLRDGDTTREVVHSTPVIVYPAALPATPANLQAISQNDVLSSVIELSWDDPADQTIIGYQITQIDDNDSEIVLVENTLSSSTSFIDNFTIPDRTVKYGVRAISPVGMSEQAISPTVRRDSSHMIPAPDLWLPVGSGNYVGNPPNVTLTWVEPTPHNLTGYRIMRRETGQRASEAHVIVADTGSTLRSYVDDTIETGVTYYYSVAAINADGVGVYSSFYDVRVPSSEHPWPAPQAPGDLAAQKTFGFNEDASATLTWSAPEPHSQSDYAEYPSDSGITRYQVLRRPIGDTGPYQLHATTPNATTTHVIGEGTYGDRYEYVVRAINPSGESDDSGPVSFRFPIWPTVGMTLDPLGLVIVPGFPGESYIDIDWDMPTILDYDFSTPQAEAIGVLGFPADGGITGYQILRRVSLSGGDYEILVADTGSASTSYRDTSGIEGVHYQYRVAAINPAGVGAPSLSNSVTLSWLPATPANLQAISQNGVFSSVIELSWDDPADQTIVGYQITQIDDNDSEIVLVENTLSSSTSFIDNFTIPDRTVKYGVGAIGPHGMSEQAISPTVRRDSSHMIPSPDLWLPVGSGNFVGNLPSVTLRWITPNQSGLYDLTGYRIMRRETGQRASEAHVIVADTGSTLRSYVDDTIETGVTYYYSVAAINADGVGVYSSFYDVRVPSSEHPWPAPQAPGDLAAQKTFGFNEDASARLTWSAPEPHSQSDYAEYPSDSGIIEYQILRRPIDDTTGPYQLHATTPNATTTHVIGEGTYGDRYEYVVRAINPSGESDDSGPVSFRFPIWPTVDMSFVETNLALVPGFPGESYVEIEWDMSTLLDYDFSTPQAEAIGVLGFPADGGITGYQILRRVSLSGGDYEILVADTGSASTSYRDTSGIEGVRYQYRVAAINPAGVGAPSLSNSVTLSWLPATPANLQAISQNGVFSSVIELSWDDPADQTIVGYQITQIDDNDSEIVLVENTLSSSTSFIDNFTIPDRTVKYGVGAIGPHGMSEQAISPTVRRDSSHMIPSPDLWLPVGSGNFVGNLPSVTLRWITPNQSGLYDLTGYRIMRRETGQRASEAHVIVADTGSTLRSYVDDTIETGVTYYYSVAAINADGVGVYSSFYDVRVPSSEHPWPAPQAPGDLAAQKTFGFNEDASARLTWSAPEPHSQSDYAEYPSDSGIIEYQILRRPIDDTTGPYQLHATTPNATTTHVIGEGTYGDRYEYVVRAINPSGESDDSGPVSFRFPIWPTVGMTLDPLGLALVPGFPGESYIDIDWDMPTLLDYDFSTPQAEAIGVLGFPADGGITGYQILRRVSLSGGDYEILVADTGSASTSYRDTSGIEGVRYQYRVAAINPAGVGAPSLSNSVTWTDWPAPQAPGDLAVDQAGDTASATLTWSAPDTHSQSDYAGYPADSGITGYQILRRIAGIGTAYELVAETSDAGVSYDLALSESDNGIEYEYVVHAVNPSGVGAASAAVSFRLELLPKAPGGLEEAVMLVWTANNDMSISGYQILRRVKDSDADYSVLVADTNDTDNFYVDDDAAYGVAYQYVVKAINVFGMSPSSNPITGTRMGTPAPDAPRNLRGEVSNGSVILNWDSPNDGSVTGYKILRRALATETVLTVLAADTGSTSATYTDASAVAGVTYAYRVVAISPAGESPMSNFVNVRVQVASAPPAVPDRPQNLSGSVSGGNIVLTWDDPSDSTITGYQIRRRTLNVDGPEASFAVIEANTNSASTSYIDTNVETGMRYAYRIYAINAEGMSATSQSTTVRR